MASSMSLSVLLPAYNEADILADNLLTVLNTLDAGAATQDIQPFEVILVDDGSRDGTAEVAREVSRNDSRIRVVSYAHNRGKGGALRSGFDYCTGKIVAFLDADLDLHPSLLFDLYQVMQTSNADVVIGSKVHPDSTIRYPFLRRLYSRGYYVLIRILFGLPVYDTQTGIKLFKRAVLERAFPRMRVTGYAFDLELLILIYLDGYKIVSSPVTVISRRLTQRIRIQDIVNMLRDTASIWWRLHRRGR